MIYIPKYPHQNYFLVSFKMKKISEKNINFFSNISEKTRKEKLVSNWPKVLQ
jgi:hypothetical protein